jgi:DNA-binding NarL/FixJ family response regulator
MPAIMTARLVYTSAVGIRVLIADDQALFREGLRTLLATYADLEVVGQAADGAEAVRLATSTLADVVLMDLRMPVMDGATAIRHIVAARRDCHVIALTTFDDDDSVFDALRAGAVGYLLKDVASEQLVEAIRIAHRGESFLQPSITTKVVAELGRLSRAGATVDHRSLATLSAREVEVLQLVARGATNKDIAVQLDITEGTVKNHMTSIFGKLGVADRTQAALRARELGIG